MKPQRQRIYLAYGSNLHPRRLAARVGAVSLLGVVQLPGWSLSFDKRGGDGSAKANLNAAPGRDCVAYAAAYAVTPEQVAMLDVFEGCGRGYETFPITVCLRDETFHAFAYLAPTHWISSALLPFDWYIDLIASGARYHQFEADYVESISRQPAQRDPDRGRAEAELTGMNLAVHAHYKS